MVRVQLPHHLRMLAGVGREVSLEVRAPVSVTSILESLESAHPVLKGTIREHGTLKRRPFLRYFAAGQDVSLQPPDVELPADIACGGEPFVIVGAIAGG
jgi:hypothetical protein